MSTLIRRKQYECFWRTATINSNILWYGRESTGKKTLARMGLLQQSSSSSSILEWDFADPAKRKSKLLLELKHGSSPILLVHLECATKPQQWTLVVLLEFWAKKNRLCWATTNRPGLLGLHVGLSSRFLPIRVSWSLLELQALHVCAADENPMDDPIWRQCTGNLDMYRMVMKYWTPSDDKEPYWNVYGIHPGFIHDMVQWLTTTANNSSTPVPVPVPVWALEKDTAIWTDHTIKYGLILTILLQCQNHQLIQAVAQKGLIGLTSIKEWSLFWSAVAHKRSNQ